SIGHRALAVNLSDLAAMGARPAWALLALTLPDADEGWLAQFAAGFGALARAHEVALVGGDTTRGPLCVTVQLLGHVPRGEGLLGDAGKRADASRAGVEICFGAVPVSETLLRTLGEERARELALTGGDDYELCFTVPAEKLPALLSELPPQSWGYSRIGALR